MFSPPKKSISIFLFVLIFLLFSTEASFAQTANSNTNYAVLGTEALGIAQMVDTKVVNIKDGSIVSSSNHDAILSIVPYDSQVLGIVSRNAAIAINTVNDPNAIPVVSNGAVYVLVSTQEGNIEKGDMITTSTIPGIGVKATTSGYVLGAAMEGYSSPNPKSYGLIAVNLDLHYFNTKPTFVGTLTDILKIALLPTQSSPAAIWKYLVAAGVVIASFVLAFLSFGRTAAKGVEALGRNPAASKIIHLGIIFNVGIVFVMVAAGLVVAFLILRL